MKPISVSASSLNNWFACQALFAAANLDRVPEFGEKTAANVGTAVHYALEKFVEEVYLKKITDWDNQRRLLELYHEGFLKTFGHSNKVSEEFKDGLALVKKWHKRTDLSEWEILSVEQYRQVPIGNTGVKLTYIFDRIQRMVDSNGRTILKVVDYKTIQRNYSHEQLRVMLQMRLYGLAAAIQAKNEGWVPDEIWVELDLLRQNDPVGIQISREENAETWQLLLDVVGLILQTDESKASRTLNPNCKYCPVAASCPQLKKHVAAGGVLGKSIEEMVMDFYEATAQADALKGLLTQLETLISSYAEKIEKTKFTVGNQQVVISAGNRRGLSDAGVAAGIIGPELMQMFGKLNIGDVDKLLDSDQITETQKAKLRRLIVRNPTKQSLKIEAPSPFAKGKNSV